MVTQWMETRATPECSLDRIHELAAQQAVEYGSSTVQRDTDNLRYSHEAVCECLRQLTPDHFRKAVRYPLKNGRMGPWLDVYLMTYRGPTGHDDPLYIKLMLDRDCVWIILCSFHLEGAL